MPAKSQSQRGLVFGKRNRYGSKAKTPDKWKWIWDEDWENKGKLPKKKNKNETVQNVIMEKYRAKTVNEMFEEDVYGDPYVSDTTSPKKANSGRWAFNPGDVVKFSLKGSPEEYSSFEWPDNMDAQKAAKFYDGQVAKINYPEEKGSKVGNKDNEYYEIRFKDGETLEGVPGYYLEPHDIFSEPKPKGSRMKDPTQVEEGDKSIDYNGERGTVIDLFMKDNDPDLFDEIVSDWGDDPDNYEDDTYLINVKGPEYDYQWFVYGRGGAYVEEGVNEGMDSYNDRGNSSDNWPSPEKWTFQEGDMVEFDLRGMAEEFSDEDEEEGRIAAAHHGEEAEIISQSTFSEIGNQDYEYYSIRFNNGDVLDAVSGYHLFT